MLGVQSWIVIIGTLHFALTYRLHLQIETRRCSYGERGSLTATCVNVNTPSFFKSTPYRFDHLDETLQCLNCSLKTVEPNSFDISGNQIKYLKLRDSGIEELQQRAFVGLVFLTHLDLSSNQIKLINAGTFAGVKKIVFVNLRNNSLESLSNDGFAELGNLETLILSENNIASVDSNAFNGLRILRLLDLRNNQISNVTNLFHNLTKLQYLDLSENSVNNLSGKDFDNLTSLLELKLEKNKIKSIPPLAFSPTANLEFLSLSNNFLENIELHAFEGLKSLETLDLANNQLSSIPQRTFQNLYSLIDLNLTGNSLSVFQISRYAGLPKLRILNISHNDIEEIDASGIFPLHDLHTLDLSYNNLTDLNFVSLLHRIPRITYLALQKNYWPCDLKQEMESFFSGENFKFMLYDNDDCNENSFRKEKNPEADKVQEVYQNALTSENIPTTQSSQIFVYILIMVLACAVLALSYGQYRISRELRFNPLLMRRRTQSEVKLVHSDLREDDNEYSRQ